MTIFCNPASTTNGTGTLLNPLNTWSGIDGSEDNEFAQIAGAPLVSTTTDAINFTVAGTAAAPKVLRSYEAGTGDPTTAKAVIVGSGAAARNGINIASDIGYWQIRDFDISEVGEWGSMSYGISLAVSAANDAFPMFVTIERCNVHDLRNVNVAGGLRANGLSLRGRGNIVRDCNIWRTPVDGIFFRGQDVLIENNRVWDTNIFGGNEADCLQGAQDVSGAVIRGNYFDGARNQGKQSVLFQNTNANRKPIQFYGNKVISGASLGQGLVCDQVAFVFDNEFIDGLYSIRAKAGLVITGNRFRNHKSEGDHFAVWCETGGATVMNNDFRNFTNATANASNRAIFATNATPANVLQNNLIHGYHTGIRFDNTVGHTESHNWIAGTVIPVANSGGNAHTLGTGTVTTDWRNYVDSRGRPRIDPGVTLATLSAACPIANAGIYHAGVRLAHGRLRPNLRPIGPYAPVFANAPV